MFVYFKIFLLETKIAEKLLVLSRFWGGAQKRADSYFPPEDRVRLVRLVSHGELPGERSGESIDEYSWNSL